MCLLVSRCCKLFFYFIHIVCLCSSEDSRSRAKRLAEEIGSFHLNVPIDSIVCALLSLFETLTGKRPHYKVLALILCTFH
jgi:NAD+ synthase (glutamine-hydrolysing)